MINIKRSSGSCRKYIVPDLAGYSRWLAYVDGKFVRRAVRTPVVTIKPHPKIEHIHYPVVF